MQATNSKHMSFCVFFKEGGRSTWNKSIVYLLSVTCLFFFSKPFLLSARNWCHLPLRRRDHTNLTQSQLPSQSLRLPQSRLSEVVFTVPDKRRKGRRTGAKRQTQITPKGSTNNFILRLSHFTRIIHAHYLAIPSTTGQRMHIVFQVSVPIMASVTIVRSR